MAQETEVKPGMGIEAMLMAFEEDCGEEAFREACLSLMITMRDLTEVLGAAANEEEQRALETLMVPLMKATDAVALKRGWPRTPTQEQGIDLDTVFELWRMAEKL